MPECAFYLPSITLPHGLLSTGILYNERLELNVKTIRQHPLSPLFGAMRLSLAPSLLLLLAADAAQAGTITDIIDTLLGRSLKPDALAKEINTKGLMANLAELQKIAAANGGNRAFGLPGYRASADFIMREVKKHKKTIDVQEQEFLALFSQTEEIALNEVGKDPLYVFGLTYSPSTSDEGITAPLVLGPAGAAGCDVSGYDGKDVVGKIVLVQRFRSGPLLDAHWLFETHCGTQ